MAWELDSTFVGRYRDQLEIALSKWSTENLAIAIANDDYARNKRFENFTRNARWHREHSAKWFRGRTGYYLKFCRYSLVEVCIERIERTATTDNGAWAVWIDKDGCSKVTSTELDRAELECAC